MELYVKPFGGENDPPCMRGSRETGYKEIK